MDKIILLSISDFKATFRDAMFKILLFFPFASFALIRWVLPFIEERYPEIGSYKQVVLMWACLQSATMFGFIYGFIFLEEKEQNIWQVIRVTPVGSLKVIFSRLLVGIMVSFFVNLCLLRFGNIVHLSFLTEIILALHFSLAAPLIALALGAFAKNRIEGLAQMKIINLLLIAPALIYFLPSKWAHITALIPTYWSNRALETADNNQNFFIFSVTGLVLYILAVLLLNRKMYRAIES